MDRLRVWVILGGLSAEREVAAASGQAVAEALRDKGHSVLTYELAEGAFLPEWSSRDVPAGLEVRLASALAAEPTTAPAAEPASAPVAEPAVAALAGEPSWAERLLRSGRCLRDQIDVAFLALHGGGGEDGTVQALLDTLRLPYTGSGPAASAIAMDKVLTKRLMQALDIPTPRWMTLPPQRPGAQVIGPPWEPPLVVKPVAEGSSFGVTIVRDLQGWEPALAAASQAGGLSRGQNPDLLVEEYIEGRELTVGILGSAALPVLEIIPKAGFYDYANKYTAGASEYQVPARISSALAEQLCEQAWRLFAALGCRGMARVDYRMAPGGEAYCLELNTIPGLTATSLLPKSAAAVGVDFGGMLERICRCALDREPRSAMAAG
jgi:D-alanine-D-alanine ligase